MVLGPSWRLDDALEDALQRGGALPLSFRVWRSPFGCVEDGEILSRAFHRNSQAEYANSLLSDHTSIHSSRNCVHSALIDFSPFAYSSSIHAFHPFRIFRLADEFGCVPVHAQSCARACKCLGTKGTVELGTSNSLAQRYTGEAKRVRHVSHSVCSCSSDIGYKYLPDSDIVS